MALFFEFVAQADGAGFGKPQVGAALRRAMEARQRFPAGDAQIREMIDRLIDDTGLVGGHRAADALAHLHLATATGQVQAEPIGHQFGEGTHQFQIAWTQGRIGLVPEAAERPIQLAVAESDRHAQVRSNGHAAGLRNQARGTHGTGIGNQLGQVSGHYLLTIALAERDDVAGLERRLGLGVHMAKDAILLAKFGEKGHVHVQVGAQGMQHLVDITLAAQVTGAQADHIQQLGTRFPHILTPGKLRPESV
ncbi:hypothetical protein Q3H58_004481 [Pseudomonas psychrotolerans]|nr:hypothetical protein [Pseudomonas psychrotolerans]